MKKIALILVTGMFCMGLWSQLNPFNQVLPKLPFERETRGVEKDVARLCDSHKELLTTVNVMVTLDRNAKRPATVDQKFFLHKLDYNKIQSKLMAKVEATNRSLKQKLDELNGRLKKVQNILFQYKGLKINPKSYDASIASLKRSTSLLAKMLQTKVHLPPIGQSSGTPRESEKMSKSELAEAIKKVENQQETLRNRRQQAQTAFQNFDQKGNQTYNMMRQTTKTMNEMRSQGVKNM